MYDGSCRYPFTHFDGSKNPEGMIKSDNVTARRPATEAKPAGKACGMPAIFESLARPWQLYQA